MIKPPGARTVSGSAGSIRAATFPDDTKAAGVVVRRASVGRARHCGLIIRPAMKDVAFTDRQLKAMRATGRSIMVSAAAGSGKTAVLSGRVAYLVCDAPQDRRCAIDELLVLTFTDAAAAEMRSRIVEAIQTRLDQHPHDHRLREQAALADAAQISTIHSFCLWLLRRWFSHVGVDPAASVLGADEEALLKSEVLEALFSDLYAAAGGSDEPLGRVDPVDCPNPKADGEASKRRSSAGRVEHRTSCRDGTRSSAGLQSYQRLASSFVRLVDDYGLGEDRETSRFVLRLFDFLVSLPNPEGWLREACAALDGHPESVVLATLADLARELRWQIDHCEQVAATLEAGHSVGHFYASEIRAYVDRLREWVSMLDDPGDTSTDGEAALARFEVVRRRIAEFEFGRARGPRLPKDVDPSVKATREGAAARLTSLKKHLFGGRLKSRFGLFSVEQMIAGLKQTAPYVATIADLVLAFRDAYTRKKRELNVLDFADLERFALQLLRSEDDAGQPSPIARTLHRRFAYVLVDEFQDINPIQQAIIRLVSRETDPDRPDNLFAVGDIKQSIYRFRLAEPAIFTERLNRFRKDTDTGLLVFLQRNFRSRPEILEAVNVLFRQLMRDGCGDILYDADAELHAGRDVDRDARHEPVELHLIERSWKDDGNENEDSAEPGVADISDPARWSPIEREAFLIGSLIRAWKGSGELRPGGEPLRYRDIAVLLRATKISAERVAAMLSSMGVPAFADVGGSLFGAREIRDVMAVLEVLDNFQQDIPVASVLRSGVLSEPFSEDDLVELRCLDRDIPFHAAVRRYAHRGADADLRKRVRTLLDRIEGYRIEVRRRPLADVLWRVYEKHGYLAYAGGLQRGAQRRANLLKLHELARRFGSFRRQGLHRFLRFIQSLEEREQNVASAPAIGEADDVVRILSIHHAKGLEFPVVFVAGLGNKFNLGDRAGRMIFERSTKIGLRVVDTERMIEYPTAAHWRVASEIERTTRDEELRILYVAMTRAREKLVLVGSMRNIDRLREQDYEGSPRHAPSLLSLATAVTPLDWVLPVLRGAPVGCVRGLGDEGIAGPLFDVHLHDVDEMAGWRVAERGGDHERALRRAAARCAALPVGEPHAPDDQAVEEVLARIDYVYPHLPSVSVRASIAASEFDGAYDFMHNPEERRHQRLEEDFRVPPSKYAVQAPDTAARRGVITHRVLQHLNFATASNEAGVGSELQRMVGQGLLCPEETALVNEASIAWFLSTPLAAAIRDAGETYRREFLYIATEPLAYFDRSVDAPPDDHVLVRGMVDGILPVKDGIEIIDFKTDAIDPNEVPERSARYREQVAMYASAMSHIWRRPVLTCWLVFLEARRCHAWRDGSWERDAELREQYDA